MILSVQDLNVKFTLRGQILHALRGVSLDVYQGESLAIVGESGSGKSVFVKSTMGLLDANGFISGGSIVYNGQDLTVNKTDRDWQSIRGKEIAMVFQDPMTSLNPLKTIGKQVQEAVELHQGLKGEAAYKAMRIDMKEKKGRRKVAGLDKFFHTFSSLSIMLFINFSQNSLPNLSDTM